MTDQPEKKDGSWFKTLIEGTQLLVGVGVYATVLGFMAFIEILPAHTPLLSLAVYPQTYIAIGLNVLVLFLLKFVVTTAAVIFVIAYLVNLISSETASRRYDFEAAFANTWDPLKKDLSRPKIRWIILLFIALMGCVMAANPQILYVGQSFPLHSVKLIFKEPIDPNLWHLTIDPTQPKSTRELELITEYTDGLLVKDLDSGTVVEVKSDLIAGIVDVSSLPTPAATTSAVPTNSVPSSTIIPTP